MTAWQWENILELVTLGVLGLYVLAYVVSAGPTTYFLITVLLVTVLASLAWLYVTFSIGKFLLSKTINGTRAVLKLPFRVIRAAPRLIRVAFFEAPVIIVFFVWFRVLVFVERHILRRAIYWFGGSKHASGIRISSVNAISPSFAPIARFNYSRIARFDLESALSLSNLAKLAYEDEGVIRYELERTNFNMDGFSIIQYHNTTGFVCLYQHTAIIAFRGTEPLNLMHIMTDLQGGLVSLSSLDDEADEVDAGRAHYGFLEALRLHRTDKPKEQNARKAQFTKSIQLDEEDTIGSAFTALFKVGGFVLRSAARSPLTLTLPRSNGKITAFQQISDALDHCSQHTDIKRIYCTGHSLGGALATVFFAQAQLSSMDQDLVSKMVVYSFGAPRMGDKQFKAWFDETGASKRVFKVVNAQDLIPRMPTLPEQLSPFLRRLDYAESPGALVHVHPLAKDSPTLEEIPGLFLHKDGHIPPIEFWGLSGLLSLQTVHKIRSESWLWILARVWIPFVMFDHLASQYANELQDVYKKSDDGHFENQITLQQ